MIIASDFPCHVGALGIFTRVTIPFSFPVETLSSTKPEAPSYRRSVARGPASWGSPPPQCLLLPVEQGLRHERTLWRGGLWLPGRVTRDIAAPACSLSQALLASCLGHDSEVPVGRDRGLLLPAVTPATLQAEPRAPMEPSKTAGWRERPGQTQPAQWPLSSRCPGPG